MVPSPQQTDWNQPQSRRAYEVHAPEPSIASLSVLTSLSRASADSLEPDGWSKRPGCPELDQRALGQCSSGSDIPSIRDSGYKYL